MQIIPIPCLTDNYAYIINDDNSKTVGVVDPSEAGPIISYLKKKNRHYTGNFKIQESQFFRKSI